MARVLNQEANAGGRLVLATRNEGKIAEFRSLLSDFDIEIMSLRDFRPIPPVREDGKSFEDNAVKKARFTAGMIGMPALADDSGLTVEILGGAPGILSARYAGEDAIDRKNNMKLLREMDGIEDRKATFICVMAIALPTGDTRIYRGVCEGVISHTLAGSGGFGYDPLFYYPPLKKRFAEMTREEKNRVSHRGKAMAELRAEFDKVLDWLCQRPSEKRSG